jgi:broad specificity phosphatase PhoE
MPRVRLVRHGHAAAGFSEDHDPGLDDLGRAQAAAVAAVLGPLGPMPIVVSPLLRTLQTAEPLALAWRVPARVDGRVAEVPSPTDDLAERGAWLSRAMAGTWADLGADLEAWRDTLVATVLGLPADTVVVSHFIAINALIGAAVGDDRVMHVSLGNGSITTLETPTAGSGSALSVVEIGAEAATEVT